MHIVNVGSGRGMPPVEMVKGVISNPMAPAADFVENGLIFANIVANHKKCGMSVVFRQDIKYFRGCFRDGPIVEGQIDDLLTSRKITYKVLRTLPPEKEGRPDCMHGFQGW